MERLENITKEAKEEIAGIVGAAYPEAGKRVDEILNYVVDKLGGSISRNGLLDYVRLYLEFLDFGDLLLLREELGNAQGKQWMVDSVREMGTAMSVLIQEAYAKYKALGPIGQ